MTKKRLIHSAPLAAATLALVSLLFATFAPGQAATAAAATSSTASPSPSPSSWTTTSDVTATSSSELQSDVGTVLANNGASSAEPAVDSDLMPKVNDTIAAGGGSVLSNVLALPFTIKVECTITYPPLRITCKVTITFNTASSSPSAPASPSPSPSSSTTTSDVSATSSSELQSDVGTVLANNGASSAEPAVDSDLMPKVNDTIAAGGGSVLSNVISLPFTIKVECTITYPPLQITCRIYITYSQ